MAKGTEKNVERKDGFSQVCIWRGTTVKEEEIPEFEKFFMDEFGVRVQYLETIDTLPDTCDCGITQPDTGGRNDVFFAVHKEDIPKFAVKRLAHGISWIEDALCPANYSSKIYPSRVFEYKTWDAGEDEDDQKRNKVQEKQKSINGAPIAD